MAGINLVAEVRRRVRNSVHSLCKELESAHIALSVTIDEAVPNGITVTVAQSSLTLDVAEELPLVDAAGAEIAGFIPADGQWHPLGYTTDSTDSLSIDGTTGDDGSTGDK